MTIAERPAPSILPFLLLSLFLHALLVALVPMLTGFPGFADDLPRPIELVALPERASDKAAGRVVDVPPPPEKRENPEANLLAREGSRAEREMLNLGRPGAPAPQALEQRPKAAPEQARMEAEEERLRSEIDALRKKREEQRREARRRDREIARLRAEAAAQARQGNGGVNEPLDDVMLGSDTRLNTRAFEESQYFIDFKTAFGVVFRPSNVTLGLSLPDSLPRRPRTIISIEVHDDGSLRGARVIRTSGYSALDRDALDAVHRVFPFDPPPRALLEANRTLRFAFEIIY